MIRVAIADDHHLVRAGLEAFFSDIEDIELVGLAVDADEAAQLAQTELPDVLLLDLNMGATSGIEAARRIRAQSPEVAMVALTAHREGKDVRACLEAGMIGFVVKDAPPEDLLRAVRDAASGASFLDSVAARTLVDAFETSVSLSDRELDVLRLLSFGLTNRQISDRLQIAEKTVKAHLTSVYAQLGVGDRTGAALWARDNIAS
ncbi:MAG: response regulator transcription factor [Acidimicrobiia bacterium]|nr:response regulator transcription factor [Acidimicrobiia bacterium]